MRETQNTNECLYSTVLTRCFKNICLLAFAKKDIFAIDSTVIYFNNGTNRVKDIH